jgi:hypothetical protein
LSKIFRAAGMGVVHFLDADEAVVSLHLQCPFRVVGGGHLLLGSQDMNYPQRDAGPNFFDDFTAMYDSAAVVLSERFASSHLTVTSVDVGAAGALAITCESDLRIDVLPVCSGPFEAWRVFRRDSTCPHHGYPQHTL